MGVTRLDSGSNPLAPVVAYLNELKQGSRVDTWLARTSTLANPVHLSAAMLERLVGIDPAINQRIRSLIAAEFVFEGTVFSGSMGQAIDTLGAVKVQMGCLVACLDAIYEHLGENSGWKTRELVRQCLAQGSAAARIADRLVVVPPGLAGTAGMLRPLGIPFMAAIHGSVYRYAWEALAGSSATPMDIEHLAFGYDHRAVGLAVARMWKFPPHVAKAIVAPPELPETIDLNWCVGMGCRIAHRLGFDGGAANLPPELPFERLKLLGVGREEIESLGAKVAEDVCRFDQAL